MALFGGVELPNRPDPENIRRLDALPINCLRDMQRYGFAINKPGFKELGDKFLEEMNSLKMDILYAIPESDLDRFLTAMDLTEESDQEDDGEKYLDSFNLNSNDKMVELLYDVLKLHEGEVTVKKTKKGDLSTGKKTLEQLKRVHPVVGLILQYRERAKLRSTYALTMPRAAVLHKQGPDCSICGRHHYEDVWRVHCRIKSTRTTTGRTASSDPNLANIPARTKLGGMIRSQFIAEKGYVISQRDWAQIELRLMADASGDQTMIDIYAKDGDIHIATAAGTFNLDYDYLIGLSIKKDAGTLTPQEEAYWKEFSLYQRAPSKNTNFAVAYLITGAGLMDLMALTFATAGKPLPDYMNEAWCDDFIRKWFGVYNGVETFLEDEQESVMRFGIAWTKTGRVRRIPEVASCHRWVKEAGVRQAGNHKIQGYSADLMKLGLAELKHEIDIMSANGMNAYPISTVYDEILVEVEEDYAEYFQQVQGQVMDNVLVDKDTGVLHSKVPIKSDGKLMECWHK